MTREEAIRRLKSMAWLYGSVEREPHIEAIDIAIEALYHHTEKTDNISTKVKSDLISRADAIGIIEDYIGKDYMTPMSRLYSVRSELSALPSADAVQGYTEWLEKIIVEAETFEWLCEETTDEEWCEKNCNYSSIQAECLRHLYEVSKGERNEKRRSGTNTESSD